MSDALQIPDNAAPEKSPIGRPRRRPLDPNKPAQLGFGGQLVVEELLEIQKRSTTNYRKALKPIPVTFGGQVVFRRDNGGITNALRLCLDSTRTIGEVRGEIKGEQERVLSLLRAYNIADMEALARILSRLTLKEAPTPDGMYETGVQLVQSAIRSNPAFRDRLRADVLGERMVSGGETGALVRHEASGNGAGAASEGAASVRRRGVETERS